MSKSSHQQLTVNKKPKQNMKKQNTKTTNLDLAQIASKQKTLIWLTVPWVILGIAPVPAFLLHLESIGFLIAHAFCMVLCYQLAALLRKNPLLWLCLALVPFVNLVAIARLAYRAAQLLKAHGVCSGLTGERSV